MARSIEIDPATGLPELPPGHFFRVGRHVIEVIADSEAGPWIPENRFNSYHRPHEYKTELVVTMRTKRHPIFPWIKREVGVPENREYVRVEAGERVAASYSSYRKDGERIGRHEGARPEALTVVTPHNLLAFAWIIAHEAWDIHESRGIVGDYPPKKFEAAE